MEAPRFVSLIGLGFGDCGKGLFTDALCRHWPVHTVVRFNGGAQAGHNVVLPDGRHHTFSQFGAGSFVPGVHTLLTSPVVVHPTALLVERDWLRRVGVDDAMTRLAIDARCRITTPYHQAAGRLLEWQRGARAHGSCGVGVGETVRHALQHPNDALQYADLTHRSRALEKLAAIRSVLAVAFDLSHASEGNTARAIEVQALLDDGLAARWFDQARELTDQVPPSDAAAMAEAVQRDGTALFEGAQGMLLDEWHGFHPHTTWSTVGPSAVHAVLNDLGIGGRVAHLGVMRAYLTRHGAGPLPTQDDALDGLAEPHNRVDGWQGAFRRGHPDALLMRYALDASGPLDGLLLSHLDVPTGRPLLRWCESYDAPAVPEDASICTRRPGPDGSVTRLHLGTSVAHQTALTRLLSRARPVYEDGFIASSAELVERVEAVAGCKVRFGSRGPTFDDVGAL